MCLIITIIDINIVGLYSQELTIYKIKVIEKRLYGCSFWLVQVYVVHLQKFNKVLHWKIWYTAN